MVVLGDLIQNNYDDYLDNPIFNFIYSFHMPLFFFLSGYTTAIKENMDGDNGYSISSLGRKISGKIKHLLIPAIVWAFIFCAINRVPPTTSVLFSCVWFLYVLCTIYILWDSSHYIYQYFNKPIWWPAICFMAIVVAFIVGFKRIPLLYLATFIYGYFFQISSKGKPINIWNALLFLIIFIVLVPHYRYGNDISGDPARVWLMLPITAVACPLCLLLGDLFIKLPQTIVNNFSLIGRYSLGIYLIHMVVIRYRFIPHSIQEISIILQLIILMTLAISIAYICIGFQHTIQRIPYVSKILFGK